MGSKSIFLVAALGIFHPIVELFPSIFCSKMDTLNCQSKFFFEKQYSLHVKLLHIQALGWSRIDLKYSILFKIPSFGPYSANFPDFKGFGFFPWAQLEQSREMLNQLLIVSGANFLVITSNRDPISQKIVGV